MTDGTVRGKDRSAASSVGPAQKVTADDPG
jgi:hypothetical protein